jgi:hypothetical protein
MGAITADLTTLLERSPPIASWLLWRIKVMSGHSLLLPVVPPGPVPEPVGAAPGEPVPPEVVNTVTAGGAEGAPEPPAASDSCANPIDGGSLRNTE